MATKKTTTKRGVKRRAATKTVEQRATTIIDDTARYDADTREAIRRALEDTGDTDELFELVRRAERGDRILDLTGEPPRDAPTLPELLSAVLNHPDLPAQLEEALSEVINDLFNDLPSGAGREIERTPAYLKLLLEASSKGGAR